MTSRLAVLARSGWPPALLLLVVVASTLASFDVPVVTTAVFVAYIALAIVVPGALVWRFVQGGSRSLVEDLAAGLAVGYAMEVLGYLPARAVGVPWLSLLVPAVTIAVFAGVPRLRRYWRPGDPANRAPALWAWSMAALIGLLVLWSCGKVFLVHGLSWPYNATPDSDMPFHLAIIGEVRHHVPPSIPFVRDEPLLYHWFVYAEIAATSWVTGIEPQTLLYRLSLLPMLIGFVVLIAVITRRLTGRWWPGPLAATITLFVLAPNPYGWPLPPFFTDYFGFGAVDDASLLRPVLWASPTQTFGALLFAPVVLLLTDLLGEHGRDRRRWVLFGVLLVVVMGAKATYLPLLLAALLLVVAVHAVRTRKLHVPALIGVGITAPCLVFAQVVLFGGASQGLRFDPLNTMQVWAMSSATGFAVDKNPPLWRLLLLAVLFATCWVMIWGGIGALRRRVLEPRFVLLLGLGIGGIGAICLFGHSGLSQGFFFQSARPYLAVAAAAGFATLLTRPTWRVAAGLLAAAGFGALTIVAVRLIDGDTVPTMAMGPKRVALALTWPYVLCLLIIGAAGGLGLLAARRWRGRVPVALVVASVLAALAGAGLTSGYSRLEYTTRHAIDKGWRSAEIRPYSISAGAQIAGRWLRDHSDADDLVATNAHCQSPGKTPCGNEHVWVSGYTERRVLVEGWAFTNEVHARAIKAGVVDGEVPYWRPEVLADNDAVFTDPSQRTVDRLRDHYHVRWLFVDERQGKPPASLAEHAKLRFRSGTCVVYEIGRR